MLSTYRASLGGVNFGQDDDKGSLWILYGIDGWHSLASTGEVTPRTARNGGWRNRAHYAPKGLTLRGSVITTLPNVGDVIDQLAAAIPLDVPEPLTVYGVNADDRLMFVRQEGTPDVSIVSPYEALYSIGLVAPDPLKYGAIEKVASTNLPSSTGGLTAPFTVPLSVDSVTISGTATGENNGNLPSPPRVIVYGPVTDARLTNVATGETLLINLTIEEGEYVDLDFATHTAYLNGTASRRGYISGAWFTLQPGVTEIAFNSPTYSATASAQIVWRDAWK
ncbi:phage distal tail protein [Kribbella sp. CA-293567]|uniref:phage distal tail protein n=1 Tax=Kribbella sp. CA-293567 TaxID=3002436 RepID=UPI0022DDB13D|nr:hypothetical protein [Kribbella sp. CA-293567]WBQ03791.1 hypothetical protein OX958_27955 [Kribbella sp. CA-293567]